MHCLSPSLSSGSNGNPHSVPYRCLIISSFPISSQRSADGTESWRARAAYVSTGRDNCRQHCSRASWRQCTLRQLHSPCKLAFFAPQHNIGHGELAVPKQTSRLLTACCQVVHETFLFEPEQDMVDIECAAFSSDRTCVFALCFLF